MSNRLDSTIRHPIDLDPVLANRAGMSFVLSRERAEQVIGFGHAVAGAFAGLAAVFRELGLAIERARSARALSALSDAALARRGLDRTGIPAAVWNGTAAPAGR